jgi:hypothetical protein
MDDRAYWSGFRRRDSHLDLRLARGGSELLASVLVCGAFCCGFLGFLRGCASMSSGLLMLAIMPVATRV